MTIWKPVFVLVVLIALAVPPQLTRSYRLAPEGRQLVVEVKIENSNVPQTMPPMRFVYEAMSRPETDRLPGD